MLEGRVAWYRSIGGCAALSIVVVALVLTGDHYLYGGIAFAYALVWTFVPPLIHGLGLSYRSARLLKTRPERMLAVDDLQDDGPGPLAYQLTTLGFRPFDRVRLTFWLIGTCLWPRYCRYSVFVSEEHHCSAWILHSPVTEQPHVRLGTHLGDRGAFWTSNDRLDPGAGQDKFLRIVPTDDLGELLIHHGETQKELAARDLPCVAGEEAVVVHALAHSLARRLIRAGQRDARGLFALALGCQLLTQFCGLAIRWAKREPFDPLGIVLATLFGVGVYCAFVASFAANELHVRANVDAPPPSWDA
jgi:hypothetical protein